MSYDSHGDKAQESILRDLDALPQAELRLRDGSTVYLRERPDGDLLVTLPGDLWGQASFVAETLPGKVGRARIARFTRLHPAMITKGRGL